MAPSKGFFSKLLIFVNLIIFHPATSTTTPFLHEDTTNSPPEIITMQYNNANITFSKLDNLTRAENSVTEYEMSTPNNDKSIELILTEEKQQSPFSTDKSENTVSSTTTKPELTTSPVLKQWLKWEKSMKLFAKNTVKNFLPELMESTGKLNISKTCARDVFNLLTGFRETKTWAFYFIDASAKMIDGLMDGTVAALGDFDQCLNIKATHDRRGQNYGKVMFTGKYCSLDMKPPLPPKKVFYKINEVIDELKEFAQGENIVNAAAKSAQYFHFLAVRLGICVPSGCETSDIQQVANSAVDDWTIKVRNCEMKRENEYTPLIISVMTVLSFFAFLLCVGSVIDLYHRHVRKDIHNVFLEILVSFSLIKNFKKLVNVKGSKGKMSCLHGFRFLSISWIVLAHTYVNAHYAIMRSSKQALRLQEDFPFQAVLNASVAVDTFFFIGGLLVCYVTVTIIRETGKSFNIVLYILHRLFRIFPVYAAVISFTFLAPVTGSGPIWFETVGPFVDACYKNWWTNLLFVNNFINTEQICLVHSWYISCDLQLYVAALLVLLPILRWPRVGLSVAVIGIFSSIITSAAMMYSYNYPPTMLFIYPDLEQRATYLKDTYFKPYLHAGPYCIGLISGYILATYPKLKFSMIIRIIGWACAIACNLAVLYGVYEWNLGRDPETAETILYAGLHRVAWALGVAWVIVNCAIGQGGIVNYILSWRVWVPLGRLTYTVYLIHPIVQMFILGNARIRLQPTHYFAVWMFFGHLMITIGSSFVASMLVEAPFISLEKIVLRAIVGNHNINNNSDPSTANSDTTTSKIGHDKPINNGTTESRTVSRL